MAITADSIYEKQLASSIDEARAFFTSEADAKYLCDQIKIYEAKLNGKVIRIFGIMRENQGALDYSDLRVKLLNYLGINAELPIYQIIGDSAPYGPQETAFATKYLRESLNEIKEGLFLYGLTGSRTDNRCCVNQIMNEWVDSHPERANHVVANIVDFHSPLAMREWGCKVAKNVSNFFLVYTNTPKPEACFGDDTYLSDSLTSKKSFCLTGGIQSFRQTVFMLSRGINNECISNLRWKTNPANYKPDLDTYMIFFSATEFLQLILQHSVELNKLSDEIAVAKIVQLKDDYLLSRHLFDPRRKDSGTKQALFNAAWKEFLDNKLWKKLPQFLTFNNYSEPMHCLYMYSNLNRKCVDLVAKYLEPEKSLQSVSAKL